MSKNNCTPTIKELRELSQQLPEKIPYLKMLVLFGSRATGNTHGNSDWDFAVLYDEDKRNYCTNNNPGALFELPMLIGETLNINPDNIDIVELNHCSWLISHFVARDGILLFEKDSGGFEYFRLTSLRDESELKKFRQEQHQLIKIELSQ
ncbi:type VII toxin-antitoxin system MntA family adenylyltransferase antitoxin [Rivularia sp. UHCC 0363]|uniref:type VII toxin-antitoxin system MntA family adenylyltransferase antitoxin n=1 Tax=Rivularia sp. UHCC 0363 TaxID=3110244 RepID=UPI002B1FB7BE|nr:nucleotidyltransferase domain-containing protein [Rivularia sp. UHCC 0363]MEA5598572.1 nucleotidyltransferase domain-containing protein [Rivularia sp. UHCC 0363]